MLVATPRSHHRGKRQPDRRPVVSGWGGTSQLIAAQAPTTQQLTDAFWQACHGGQRRLAEHLLALGAELNGTPSWGDSTPLDAADYLGTGRESLLTWLKEQGAKKTVKDGV